MASSRCDSEIVGTVLSYYLGLKPYPQEQLPFGRDNITGCITGENITTKQRVFCSFYCTRCINLQVEKKLVNKEANMSQDGSE